jgi:hypothetical protein
MSCMKELLELQSVLPTKCLELSCKKPNIALKCVTSLTVPILITTEHIQRPDEVQCLKMYKFLLNT